MIHRNLHKSYLRLPRYTWDKSQYSLNIKFEESKKSPNKNTILVYAFLDQAYLGSPFLCHVKKMLSLFRSIDNALFLINVL